mmetsp:Transcript_18048/g.26092  ORF Transcript_18048/g.26092 Transcript_18048/m.26092 type:complete len:110 (+) Transcript_18048:108-437(+)
MTTTHLQVVDDGGTAIEDLFTGDLFNIQKKLQASITAGSCAGEIQLLGTADGHLVIHLRSTDPRIERPGRGRILDISVDTLKSGFASVLSDHEDNYLYVFNFKEETILR